MAGASINIDYDDREITAALSELQRRVGNIKPVLADIVEHLLNTVVERASTQWRAVGTAQPRIPEAEEEKC